MNRRMLLQTVVAGTCAAGLVGKVAGASYFPAQVDQTLFEGINRVKDPAKDDSTRHSER